MVAFLNWQYSIWVVLLFAFLAVLLYNCGVTCLGPNPQCAYMGRFALVKFLAVLSGNYCVVLAQLHVLKVQQYDSVRQWANALYTPKRPRTKELRGRGI